MSLKYSWILALLGAATAQSVDGSKYNNPTAGPPASFFTAATTIPVAALQTAAAKASIAAGNVATYPVYNDDSTPTATIHKDWVNFSEVNLSLSPLILLTEGGSELTVGK